MGPDGNSYDGPERRRYPRVTVFVNIRSLTEGSDLETVGLTKNLSEGGVCLTVRHELQKDTVLHLEFTLPNSQHVLCLDGRVAWQKTMQVDSDTVYDVGVEFTQVEEDVRETIAGYVDTCLRQK